ncbi:hypothetical protein ACFW04_012080 [Cataglyphis niger]
MTIMSPCTFEEINTAGVIMVLSLEEETKDLQIEEKNAIIDEERSSDLQLPKEYKEFAEKNQDSKEKDDRLKALPNDLKRQEKKRIDSVISCILCQRTDCSTVMIRFRLQEIMFMFERARSFEKHHISRYFILLQRQPSESSSDFSVLSITDINIIAGNNSPQSKSLNYLLDCYSRIVEIENNSRKTENINYPKRSSVSSVSDVLTILNEKCVPYSSHVLQGLVGKGASVPTNTTHLFYPILSQRLPDDYLKLMAETCKDPSIFNQIFSPFLQSLFLLMQRASLVGNTPRRPINALSKLIEICCGPSNNIRPIYFLIINPIQFLPDFVTSIADREFTTNSFLGPFLSVSIFTEKVEKFFSGDSNTKTSLYKIFDAIFANNKCRDAILEYLTILLRYNEKRAQIQTKEDASSLAKNGFMLNLLSILQMLCMMIELNTVDQLYPFNSSTFIKIKKDTRLKLTLQEAAEWQKQFKNTHRRMKPTFTTKYLLTGLEDFIEQQWTQELMQLVKSKLCAEAILLSILTQTAPGSPLLELPLSQEVMRNFTALPKWYIGDICKVMAYPISKIFLASYLTKFYTDIKSLDSDVKCKIT